jgi:hypothetical protein
MPAVPGTPYTVTSCCCGDVCCPTTPSWVVTFGTVTGNGGGEIQGCDELTGLSIVMDWQTDTPHRTWFGEDRDYVVSCVANGQFGWVQAYLYCNPSGSGTYQLLITTDDLIGLASYTIDMEDWDCENCNVMTLDSQQVFCCIFPETITVCPVGSSSSSSSPGPGEGGGMGMAELSDYVAPSSSSSPKLRPTTPRKQGKCCGKLSSSTSTEEKTASTPSQSSSPTPTS